MSPAERTFYTAVYRALCLLTAALKELLDQSK